MGQASVPKKPEKCRQPDSLPCDLCGFERLCFPGGDLSERPVAAPMRRTLAAGQHLSYAGQVRRGIQVLRSGSIRGYSVSSDGTERTTDIYLPGEPIGLEAFGGWRQPDYLVAMEPSSYCEVPLARVRQLMTDKPAVRDAVPYMIGSALLTTRQRLLSLSQGPARAQLSTFLLDLRERRLRRGLPGDHFRLGMDRQDIAGLLGLTMETVSRAMGELRKAGLIAVSGKHLTILDPSKLRREAEGTAVE